MEMDGQLKPRNNIKMSKEVGKVIKVNKINSNDINERLSVDKKTATYSTYSMWHINL